MADSLYVCHFSNGHIKVGRSVDPMARIAAHEDRVACMGVLLSEHFKVECVGSSVPAERALIEHCASRAERRHSNEWFAGLDFAEVCEWASKYAAQTYAHDTVVGAIRERLGLTQTEFAEVVGCTQGNVGHYERGQPFQIDRAVRLIEHAEAKGLTLTLDQIYGRAPLPTTPEPTEAKAV